MESRLKSLLQKYDVAGPRYTSYPTAPAWTNAVGETDFQKNLLRLKPDEPLSLYFHIPFCETLCHFCGCMKVITKDHSRSKSYVDLLLAELDRIAGLVPKNAGDVSQMHFGGGSPNYLQPEELREIVERARSHFRFEKDAEIAIEMHPRTSTPEFCAMTAQLGFNRISLGVQDFDPLVQKLINRHQTYGMTASMVEHLRKLGLRAFNFDLIYGLPGQTLAEWTKTIEQVIGLGPNRLAVYSYAHVPWLKPYQRSFEDKDLPAPEMKLQLFETAYETFTKNGYRPIGMDHFALEEDDLTKALDDGTIHRNFMGYSTKADAHQIGFGVSAISCVGGGYFQNLKELKAYEDAVGAGKLAAFRGHLPSRDDRIRRDLIRLLMCTGKIAIRDFATTWSIDFHSYFSEELPRLKPFLDDGLLAITGDHIVVLGEGHLFLRNMAIIFDRYLEDVKSSAKNPVFSRTV